MLNLAKFVKTAAIIIIAFTPVSVLPAKPPTPPTAAAGPSTQSAEGTRGNGKADAELLLLVASTHRDNVSRIKNWTVAAIIDDARVVAGKTQHKMHSEATAVVD